MIASLSWLDSLSLLSGRSCFETEKKNSHPSVSMGNWFQDLCRYQNGRKLKSHSWSLVSEVPHPWIQPTMDCVVLNHTRGHTQLKPVLLMGQLYFHILVMDLDLKTFCCLFFCFNFLKGKSLWISSRLIMWYTHLNHIATFKKYFFNPDEHFGK